MGDKINNISESDIYNKMLQLFFQYHGHENESQKSLRELSMIKLINLLSNHNLSKTSIKDTKILQNAMLLILALFNNTPADHLHSIGKELKDLSLEEKNEILTLLTKLLKE